MNINDIELKNIKNEHKGNITEEQIALLKKKITESLSIDRYSLVCEFPFTGAISMRMDLVPVRDKRCRTACTDGKTVYFDCDFYSKLNKKERIFVLAHEIWHCVMMHLSRCQSRNHDLFNIASDMEVNQLLLENCSNKLIEPPKSLLFPPKEMIGKSAETIYDWLLKTAKKQTKNQNGNSSNCNSNSSTGTSRNDKSNSNSTKSQQKKNGKDTGNLEGQFDKHTYVEDSGDADVNDKITDQWGEVGYDSDFIPHVSKDIAEKMREAAIAAAQQCQRTKGNLPAGVKSLLDKLIKPEVNWREQLSQFVTSCYNGSRRWLPPNRRHVYNDMYFQSRRSERIEGVIAIDTSGSCIGDLPKFFGELKGIIDTFGDYHLTVICADAAVDQVDIYDSNDNPLIADAGKDIAWSGGGGTDYGPVFKYIDKEGIQPNFVIYIGDGYAEMSYKRMPNYPVLWLLTKDGNESFCSWGKKLKFKLSSYE